MSKLLSAEIHAVYWSPLTARAWRILNWLRAEKAPRSRYAIAETVKIPPSALTALAPMLLEQGFVREVPRKDANSTYAPLLGLTKRGRIAGKKRLPHSLVAAVAPMTAELTSSVAITTRARALLLFLRDQLMAGKIPSLKEIAAELRRTLRDRATPASAKAGLARELRATMEAIDALKPKAKDAVDELFEKRAARGLA